MRYRRRVSGLRRHRSIRASSPCLFGVAQPTEETMNAMKQIVIAVSLVVISLVAPVVKAQQGVEKPAPATLVAPAEALNSLLNITESQMLTLVKALPEDKYGFAPSAAIFAPGQQTEYAGVRISGHWSFTSRRPITLWVRA